MAILRRPGIRLRAWCGGVNSRVFPFEAVSSIVKPSLGKVRVGAGMILMVFFWCRVFPVCDFDTVLVRLRFQFGYAEKHDSESSSAASPKTISKT